MSVCTEYLQDMWCEQSWDFIFGSKSFIFSVAEGREGKESLLLMEDILKYFYIS